MKELLTQAHSFPQTSNSTTGRLLALDMGTKRVGVAICDELRMTVRPLAPLSRSNWKNLLIAVRALIESFQITAIVLGLPLRLDGTSGDAAVQAQEMARRLQLSLQVPVYLQDERLTSVAAQENLKRAGVSDHRQQRELIDSEAATLILSDFIAELDRKPFCTHLSQD